MNFGDRPLDFHEANRRYADLMRQHDAGAIGEEEFEARLKRLMVLDEEGRWWANSASTGEWLYHDGSAWVKDTQPDYRQPQSATRASASPGMVTYTIQSVVMDSSALETVADVTVVLTANDGSTNVRNTYFVYEGGDWKHRFSQEEYDLLMPDASYEEFVAAQ